MPAKSSPTQLIAHLSQALGERGYFYAGDDVLRYTSHTRKTYVKYFGGWGAACQAAGFWLLPGKRATLKRLSLHCVVCQECIDTAKAVSKKYCSEACRVSNRPKRLPRGMPRDLWLEKVKADAKSRILAADFELLGWDTRRKRILWEQDECCNRCGIREWLGQKLTLEVDHKNGDRSDHTRSNLEALCPNCHSLTPTWRGRNKVKPTTKLDVSELKRNVTEGLSLSAALKAQGKCGKGSGHQAAKRALAASTQSTHA